MTLRYGHYLFRRCPLKTSIKDIFKESLYITKSCGIFEQVLIPLVFE